MVPEYQWFQENYLSVTGIVLIILYFAAILLLFNFIRIKKYSDVPILGRLFILGILLKLLAGLAFGFVYDIYYYRNADVFFYFTNASKISDILWKSPTTFFQLLLGMIDNTMIVNVYLMTGYCIRIYSPDMFAIDRFLSPFALLGFKNFYTTILVLNAFLFLLNWKTFMLFRELIPGKDKVVAFCILFIPSVLFWSSGTYKDSFCFTFSLLFIFYFHRIFLLKKFNILNFFKLLFCVYILIYLKPYILFSLLVSCFIWLGLTYGFHIRNNVIRVVVFPSLMVVVGFFGLVTLNMLMRTAGGHYEDIDSMLEKASEAQYDLKQEYYEGASFDIGSYAPTIEGALSRAPAAVIAALYRPFLWEVRTIFQFISALENMAMLVFSLWVIFKVGPKFLLFQFAKNPVLAFCFIYVLNIALGIGLSTSNFGALARFKIPFIPFFFLGFFILYFEYMKERAIKGSSTKYQAPNSKFSVPISKPVPDRACSPDMFRGKL